MVADSSETAPPSWPSSRPVSTSTPVRGQLARGGHRGDRAEQQQGQPDRVDADVEQRPAALRRVVQPAAGDDGHDRADRRVQRPRRADLAGGHARPAGRRSPAGSASTWPPCRTRPARGPPRPAAGCPARVAVRGFSTSTAVPAPMAAVAASSWAVCGRGHVDHVDVGRQGGRVGVGLRRRRAGRRTPPRRTAVREQTPCSTAPGTSARSVMTFSAMGPVPTTPHRTSSPGRCRSRARQPVAAR